MKTRPQDYLITTLVGVDDSFGRCVATCVERKGARDVLGAKALVACARSLGQPRLVIHSDGEPAILDWAAACEAASDTDGFEGITWQSGASAQGGRGQGVNDGVVF